MAVTIEPIEWWRPVGSVPAGDLVDARLQLHWAMQLIASVGLKCAEPREDGSHVSTEWLDGPSILAGRSFGGALPIQLALEPSKLTLRLQDYQNTDVITKFPLAGKTLAEAAEWLSETLAGLLGEDKSELEFRRPPFEIPDHPVGNKKPFRFEPVEAFEEMEKWISNGYHAVQAVQSVVRGASEVRCWPQTLDMTTLVNLDDSGERTLRAGLSQGDQTFDQPYFYVTPWPQPGDATVPSLDHDGDWNLSGWFGAVLTGSKVVVTGDGDAQASKVASFWTKALDACMQLLEPAPQENAQEDEHASGDEGAS